MKITHDREANAVYIYFKEAQVVNTVEDTSGRIVIDYAADGSIVGIEVLNASEQIKPTIEPNYIQK